MNAALRHLEAFFGTDVIAAWIDRIETRAAEDEGLLASLGSTERTTTNN